MGAYPAQQYDGSSGGGVASSSVGVSGGSSVFIHSSLDIDSSSARMSTYGSRPTHRSLHLIGESPCRSRAPQHHEGFANVVVAVSRKVVASYQHMRGLSIGDADQKLMVHERAKAAARASYLPRADAAQGRCRCPIVHLVRRDHNARALQPRQRVKKARVGQPRDTAGHIVAILNKPLHHCFAAVCKRDILDRYVFHSK